MSDTLGHIPTISLIAKQSDMYFLQMWLHNVTVATSFEDLKVRGETFYLTFQAACHHLGLLDHVSKEEFNHERCFPAFIWTSVEEHVGHHLDVSLTSRSTPILGTLKS